MNLTWCWPTLDLISQNSIDQVGMPPNPTQVHRSTGLSEKMPQCHSFSISHHDQLQVWPRGGGAAKTWQLQRHRSTPSSGQMIWHGMRPVPAHTTSYHIAAQLHMIGNYTTHDDFNIFHHLQCNNSDRKQHWRQICSMLS